MVYLKKNNDYSITSFTCFIKLDMTKRKNYKKNWSTFDEGFNLEKVFLRTDDKGLNDDEWEPETDKKRRNLYTEQYKYYDSTENRIQEVEVFVH